MILASSRALVDARNVVARVTGQGAGHWIVKT
jgi:hypothetical protein